MSSTSLEEIETTVLQLLAYCRANNWTGYDPYDALNSRVFSYLPFLDFGLARLVLTQALKRSPLNFRPLLMVQKMENPKAIALFLMAFLKLERLGLFEDKELITLMTEKIINLRCANNAYWCWGYSFPWQTRTVVVPRGAPNIVCTSFVANALLDAYERFGEQRYLNMAASASEYILGKLYWTDDHGNASFSYPLPSLRMRIHNANFLGAALLARAHKISGEKGFLEPALKVARCSAAKQNVDGSWDYGEGATQRWVDNFHTGYNLCALKSICQCVETSEFEPHIRRGFEFYRKHFFAENGAPKYFHHRTYPIDIHSVAQSIITLLSLRELDESNVGLAHDVFRWAMTQMWNEEGYFYYQVHALYKIRIPYMRWSQSWMQLALATLLEHLR